MEVWECKNSSYICAQILERRRGLSPVADNPYTDETNISALEKKT